DRNVPVRLGQGVTGWVAQEGKAILWPSAGKETDQRYKPPFAIKPERGVKSFLCVPLRSKGKTLGVIEIRRKETDENLYREDDLATLAVIADYAAIAIENARNFARIQELTITDDLTTLFNVRHMHTLLDSEVLRAGRYRKQFSLIFLDLDHFKNVNDTYGHMHGSQLLKETAEVIQSKIRSVDHAARYGGDEFVILLPETDKADAIHVANRVREAIEQHSFLQEKKLEVHFTASFGVATYPDDAQTKDDLIHASDEAMYKVKNSTRNRVEAA
ncbi:MAG TPA: sensor domain-containing diguanylate cyclase, partial [Bdellovibrionota bacterium]|nr:sensor domain-containing diguanylate cyclase [Bdellovibrionota bacterium]